MPFFALADCGWLSGPLRALCNATFCDATWWGAILPVFAGWVVSVILFIRAIMKEGEKRDHAEKERLDGLVRVLTVGLNESKAVITGMLQHLEHPKGKCAPSIRLSDEHLHGRHLFRVDAICRSGELPSRISMLRYMTSVINRNCERIEKLEFELLFRAQPGARKELTEQIKIGCALAARNLKSFQASIEMVEKLLKLEQIELVRAKVEIPDQEEIARERL